MTAAPLESSVLKYGREIFAGLRQRRPFPLTPRWFDDRLMGLTMGNEALKVQLFRFIDTLPYLHEPTEVSRHLREYLGQASDDLPWWTRSSLFLIPSNRLGGRVLASAARSNATRMARKFIVGSNLQEAVKNITQMRRDGYAHTIDLLGEATVTEAEADAVYDQYIELLTGLAEESKTWTEIPEIDRDDRDPIPRVNVSVKLSALYSQFDPIDPVGTSRAVCARLRPILSLAKKTGAFVNFDMEQHSFKDTTLYIFRELLSEPEFRDWPHVGIAMQAYLRDTETDLRSLLNWAKHERGTRVWVRLVKGAYWDYESVHAAQNGWPVPVFQEKWESDASFERCSTFLLEHHEWLTPAFASHNIRSLAHAIAVAEKLQVPKRRYEFQMLYGMADPIKQMVKSLGYRVRVYAPYGELLPGMAYLVRRLLENTSNDSFLRQGFAEGVAQELLLRNPHVVGELEHKTAPTPPAPAETGSMNAAVESFQNEPLADFALEKNRKAMADALATVQPYLGHTYPLVIDNAAVNTTATITSVNPSHHAQIVGKTAQATIANAEAAVASCVRAFDSWRDTPVEDRAKLLRKMAEIFRRRRWELSAWIVFETGKPWREADADVAETIDFCNYYADEGIKLQSGTHVRNVPGEDNALYYEPRGVAVVIAPWNFPLAILAGMATAALITGNTVILKPAEQSGVVGAKLMEVFQEAGVPKGVVNFLPGIGEEIGPVLVGHPEVALIAFTGSLNVALAINEQASRTPPGQKFVKKVIAEMGGKNAIIIDDDADLDEAVRGVIDSAFGYCGQKCSAGSRAIVLQTIYPQFMNRLIEAAKSLTIAPADQPGCAVGPVIDADSQSRINKTIEQGKAEAKLAYQHDVGTLAATGYFVGPTIFSEVPENATIAQEEIFGPVLCVIKAKNLDDALRIANGTKYALTGGVYSRSPANLEQVKRRFRVGNLYVNRKCTGALVDRQPFGGFKLSGIGSKAGGPDYLLQFVVPRTVTENTLRRGFAPNLDS